MYQDKVSVLIATYNRLDLLLQAVSSVQTQEYANIEIVIHDDGSTDGTREWGERAQNSQLVYRYSAHRGPRYLGDIFNEMLDTSDGSYILLLDSDDCYAHSKAIATLVAPLATGRSVLAFGSAQLMDENGKNIPDYEGAFSSTYHAQFDFNSLSDRDMLIALLKRCFIPANAVAVSRDALDAIGGFVQFQGFVGQDYPTWLALALIGRITYVEDVVTSWRTHSGQLTSSRGVEISEGALRVAQAYFQSAMDAGVLDLPAWRDIEQVRRRAVARSCWASLGPYARGHNWNAVRELAVKQWRDGDRVLRFEALAALLSALLHVDIVNPALIAASVLGVRIGSE